MDGDYTMAYKPKIIKPIKPRKLYTYDFPNGNNGGMNCSVPADRIRQDQSPDMLNMCYKRGTLDQRHGFDISHRFPCDKPIRGMFAFEKTDGSTVMLTVTDGKVYEEELINV